MAVATSFPWNHLTGVAAATASTTQTQAGGTAVAAALTVATVANASDALTLPRGCPGQVIAIKGGANAAKLFPASGGKVNNGTADAAFTLAATVLTLVVYITEVDVVAVQGAV